MADLRPSPQGLQAVNRLEAPGRQGPLWGACPGDWVRPVPITSTDQQAVEPLSPGVVSAGRFVGAVAVQPSRLRGLQDPVAWSMSIAVRVFPRLASP